MKENIVKKAENGLKGTFLVPGDKSISHRAVIFGALADGKTEITGFLMGEDCLNTISCLRELGLVIEEKEKGRIIVEGRGRQGLLEPKKVLDVGNSGTTIRLLAGFLASLPFSSVLIGDDSIGKRPMARVTGPLKMMNASIDGREYGQYTPLCIRGGHLTGIHYLSPVASAQVKSSILIAGLGAIGKTTVTEPYRSRDHTERMLKSFGVAVEVEGHSVSVEGGQELIATDIQVPGDISSAAFFLVAGLMVPASEIVLEGVGINPTRTGILDVISSMGGKLELMAERKFGEEPVADLRVSYSDLTGVEIGGDLIPRLIDEIPAIAVLATQAHGTTVIKDAAELKVKETNRIDATVNQLKKLGAHIEATEDGMKIVGPTPLKGGQVDSLGDHRIGMALALAGLISDEPVLVKGAEAIAISYPEFFADLDKLRV